MVRIYVHTKNGKWSFGCEKTIKTITSTFQN